MTTSLPPQNSDADRNRSRQLNPQDPTHHLSHGDDPSKAKNQADQQREKNTSIPPTNTQVKPSK